MVESLQLLTNTRSVSHLKETQVLLPTGNVASVSHIGSSCVFSNHDAVTNVLHIPDFKYNLLSVSKLTKELHWAVHIYPDFCIFQDLFTGQVKGIGREKGDLYILTNHYSKKHITEEVSKSNSVQTCAVESVQTSEIDAGLWHRRLGHVSAGVMKTLGVLGSVHCESVCSCSFIL